MPGDTTPPTRDGHHSVEKLKEDDQGKMEGDSLKRKRLGKMSKTSRGGGGYIFVGGCRPYSPILGEVYMKLNQFGVVSLNFIQICGGFVVFV